MLTNVEHIGIAVTDLAASSALFAKLLRVAPYKTEAVESEGVMTSFFRVNPGHESQTKIELLAATDPDSPIAKFLTKKGEGIHHIAFEVSDIVAEMERLRNEGFVVLNDTPKRGADNKLVCFLHPKGTNGVLVELCQEIEP
ncbi:MAG: methylmalonyl-CoA epimerase [Bacteroidetes bacterium]|nr:methylmalonyl-CoA epimerase [Fibrella sp.]